MVPPRKVRIVTTKIGTQRFCNPDGRAAAGADLRAEAETEHPPAFPLAGWRSEDIPIRPIRSIGGGIGRRRAALSDHHEGRPEQRVGQVFGVCIIDQGQHGEAMGFGAAQVGVAPH